MLSCRDLATVASDYLDGELSPLKRLSVKTHLMMCRDCRNFIGNLRASVALMQGHSSQQPDDAFLERIDADIQEALERHSHADTDR